LIFDLGGGQGFSEYIDQIAWLLKIKRTSGKFITVVVVLLAAVSPAFSFGSAAKLMAAGTIVFFHADRKE
jgi:hypothetical protein